jgi:hypothetical protein
MWRMIKDIIFSFPHSGSQYHRMYCWLAYPIVVLNQNMVSPGLLGLLEFSGL